MKHIISIIPTLNKIGGHEYWYHLSVAQAAHEHGLQHSALIPKELKIKEIPSSWLKILPSVRKSFLPKLIFRPLEQIAQMSYALYKAFKFLLTKENKAILFYERFSHIDLLSLFIALFLLKQKPEICLFYRVVPEYFKKHKKKHLKYQKLLEKLISPSKMVLMTDTVPLSQSLEIFFQKSVAVMPIPHTYSPLTCSKPLLPITFWWPGGMREEKGTQFIQKLALSFNANKHKNLQLVLVEEMQPLVKDSCFPTIWVKSEMPREEFENWMQKAQIVLLPYLPNIHYQASSSGLFVEAIVSGCMPFGSEGTWIAHELCQHNLKELILDWNQADVIDKIITLYQTPSIHVKLKKMQDCYQNFHSQNNFNIIFTKNLLQI